MRKTPILLTLIVVIAFAGSALAVPPGKTVNYPGGELGKVVFDGKSHADKGLKCTDCHTKVFPMKTVPGIKMTDMNAGKNCGACHNGEKSFKSGDPANCVKCHKK